MSANETLSGTEYADLTNWILNLHEEEFQATFVKLKLRDTGNPNKNYLAMMYRLAGHYSAEDFQINVQYATLSPEELRSAPGYDSRYGRGGIRSPFNRATFRRAYRQFRRMATF